MTYEEFVAKQETVMRLQYVGMVPATYARNVKVGDRVMWNGGSTTEITAIDPKGAQSLAVTYKLNDGNSYTRTHRLTGKLAAQRDGKWLGDLS